MKDNREPRLIREHYVVEKQLAERLRTATPQERQTLYTTAYDEMFKSVPHHPMLTRKESPTASRLRVASELRFLQRFLNKRVTFLEIGPGDCALAFEVAKSTRYVHGVDVSRTLTSSAKVPENFELVISDGSSIPLPKASIDVAYSNQLMEHLHPDDAEAQLKNIYDLLAAGGTYICITPNRLNGPHDISRYFDIVATGFHLKEYTLRELHSLFRRVGFARQSLYVGSRGRYFRIPLSLVVWLERILQRLPTTWGRRLAKSRGIRAFLFIRLVGTKGPNSSPSRHRPS